MWGISWPNLLMLMSEIPGDLGKGKDKEKEENIKPMTDEELVKALTT